MAGLGSIISAYVMCMIYEKKVNPLVYTYALLAGPVAIGSCLLVVGP
jgi:ammonium transporter Rh